MQVLILEDDYLISLDLGQLVEDLGHEPHLASSCAAALRLIEKQDFDFALLDVNLGKEDSLPIADRMSQEGVAFAFLTGAERNILPERYRSATLLSKPCATAELRRALEAIPDPAAP